MTKEDRMFGRRCRLTLLAVSGLLVLAQPARGQYTEREPLQVGITARLGLIGTLERRGPACGGAFIAPGLEARTPGRIFAVAVVDWYVGSSGGGANRCLPPIALDDDELMAVSVGGFDLANGGRRMLLGAGHRWGHRPRSYDVIGAAGLTRARSATRNWHPWVGGMANVNLWRDRLTVGWEHGWNRLVVLHRIHGPDGHVNGPPLEVLERRYWAMTFGLVAGMRF
jgi:hypothetical protein